MASVSRAFLYVIVLVVGVIAAACSKSDPDHRTADLAPKPAAAEKSTGEAPRDEKKETAPTIVLSESSSDLAEGEAAKARVQPVVAADGTGRYGALQFEGLRADLGKIRDTLPVTMKFPFKNTSDSTTVTFKDFSSTCGCVGARTAKPNYAPGESGEVEVIFNPQGREGKDEKAVTVVIDDPQAPAIALTVTVEIVPVIYVDPKSIYIEEKKSAFVQKKPSKTVTLISRLGGLEITSAKVLDPQITVRTLDPDTVEVSGEKCARHRYEIVADKELPLGRVTTKLEIRTNDPSRPLVTIPVVVESSGELKLSQNPIYLRMRVPNIDIKTDLLITPRANQPFKILSAEIVDATGMELDAKIAPMPSGSKMAFQRVTIHGKSPEHPNDVRAKLVVTTDVEEQKTIEVPIFGGFPEGTGVK